MEQAAVQKVAPVDVVAKNISEWFNEKKECTKKWYNSECRLYTVMVGESVTWRALFRIHMILVCMLVGIIAVEQNFMVAGASMASSGWLVYRLNVDEKAHQTQQKKGGKR